MYDSEGRLAAKNYPDSTGLGTITYQYDSYGNCTGMDTEEDPVRESTYDGLGRVSVVRDYDAAGSAAYMETVYEYDLQGRVISMITEDESGTLLESFHYAYDKNNQILTREHVNNLPEEESINESRAYTYDDHGNLIESRKSDYVSEGLESTTTYAYDGVGNRIGMQVDDAVTEYTYNGLNQLLSACSGNSRTEYTYDARGNQILEETTVTGETEEEESEEEVVTTTAMEYAVTGEMLSLTEVENGETTLTQKNVYDQDGIRIGRTENGTTRSYYYDGGSVAYTKDEEAVSSVNLLTLSGTVVGTYREEDYYTYLKDVQGSSTNLVKEDGTLAAAYDYTDFGETTELTGSGFDNQICYTGGIYDEASKLYYLNARYYDPETGRFLAQDSYRGEMNDSDQWHLYVYCANNPINYVDPSGHWSRTYTREQARNTYVLFKAIKITWKAITVVREIGKILGKKVGEILREEIKGYLTNEAISATLTPLNTIYKRFVEGFRRGGYDCFRVTKYSKRLKKICANHEKILKTKLQVCKGSIKFYHSSASRKNVIMRF